MCGIAGIVALEQPVDGDAAHLQAMCDALAHRGPDDQGAYRGNGVWLGHRRLSIIDLAGGHQPLSNEDGSVWITCGGEIFNYRQLRSDLQRRGHRFATQTDTEVVVHLYEEFGTDCFARLNGQFALALWDARENELILARDPHGILPLFHTHVAGRFLFASEVKALLAGGRLDARMDLKGLAHLACFGAVLAPRTMFRGIRSLEPGMCLRMRPGQADSLCLHRFGGIRFPAAGTVPRKPESYWRERLGYELREAVRRRLVSDIPIGLYLSGGLDSSIVGALMHRLTGTPPAAFNVAFDEAALDESGHAAVMARHMNSPQHTVRFNDAMLAETIAPLVRSAESPMFSVEPAPLWRLAERTARNRHVVLSGQGADEMFGGYPYVNIARFRDAMGRPPWSLLRGAMAWVERRRAGTNCVFPSQQRRRRVRGAFGFEPSLDIVFAAMEHMAGLFSAEVCSALGDYTAYDDLPFGAGDSAGWHPFDRSMYVAYKTNLENYLLSVQGDRPAMAHAVEVRFPFLDPELIECCAQIPPELRHRRGCEKYILREAVRGLVPEPIRLRRKQPFMAAWGTGFVGDGAPAAIRDLLSAPVVREKGYFDPDAVCRLVGQVRALADAARPLSSFASLAFNRRFGRLCLYGMGINLVVTTHLWDELFCSRRSPQQTPKLAGMHHTESRIRKVGAAHIDS